MMDGRWTIRWQPYEAGVPGGYKIGGTEPWPGDDGPTPVVPCDDEAVERARRVVRVLLGPLLGDDEEIDAIVRGVFLAAKAETLELRGETS